MVASCATVLQTPIPITRSLRSVSVQLSGTEGPSAILSGIVIDHSSISFDELESWRIEFRTENSSKTKKLRYILPNEERIPVEVDDRIEIYTKTTKARDGEKRMFTSMGIKREGEWVFILSEQKEVPDIEGFPLEIIDSGEISFRESGRMQGLCEAVRLERQLLLEWKARRYSVFPGQSLRVQEGREQDGYVTLVQNSEVINAQCQIDPNERASLYFIVR